MATSKAKIREAFGQWLDNAQIDQLYLAMRSIDRAPGAPMTRAEGWATADKLLQGFGVERIERGRNARSPWIKYVNLGDTYTTTVLRHGNRSTCYLGCWGDIVERGDYA